MYYLLQLDHFPSIIQHYTVTRNTVWKIAERYHILIFVKDGSCRISLGNEEYILHAGDVFFVPRNHPYTRSSINGEMCTMTYVQFLFSNELELVDSSVLVERIVEAKRNLADDILSTIPLPRIQSVLYLQNKYTHDENGEIFRLLDEIQAFSARRQLMCEFQSSISLCSILSLLSQQTIDRISSHVPVVPADTVPENLKKAVRFIRSHYSEKITLDTLTAHCNISKQQLIRYFKRSFHTTPIAYINDYKITRAKDLLLNQPHLTVKEISDELCFSDQHYFSKVFRKAAGESPAQYRSRLFSVSPHNRNQK